MKSQKIYLPNLHRALNLMYYVYLLKNKINGGTYIGYTDNIERRFHEHEKNNKNIELIYYEAYKNKQDATDREKRLKQRGQSIRWLKKRIPNSLN